jgi:hypothetical protein
MKEERNIEGRKEGRKAGCYSRPDIVLGAGANERKPFKRAVSVVVPITLFILSLSLSLSLSPPLSLSLFLSSDF